MTIAILTNDSLCDSFRYLPDQDLDKCQKVNKRWKQVIEKNDEMLFSQDFLSVKASKNAFIRTRYLLKAVNKEIAELEVFMAQPANQLGLFEIGLSSFSLLNEKCASYQNQMQLKAEKHKLLKELKLDHYNLSLIHRVELLTLKNIHNHHQIKDLFGKRGEFNKLPIIDISLKQEKQHISNMFISPGDMEKSDPKGSIVRGFDMCKPSTRWEKCDLKECIPHRDGIGNILSGKKYPRMGVSASSPG